MVVFNSWEGFLRAGREAGGSRPWLCERTPKMRGKDHLEKHPFNGNNQK